MDIDKILTESNKIISEYNPNFFDSFKKNRKIYEQAIIIKNLIGLIKK